MRRDNSRIQLANNRHLIENLPSFFSYFIFSPLSDIMDLRHNPLLLSKTQY